MNVTSAATVASSSATNITYLQIRLTPHACLLVEPGANTLSQSENTIVDPLVTAFARSAGGGLVWLATTAISTELPPAFAWWRDFAARYIAQLCSTGEPSASPLPEHELASLVLTAPMMPGSEYVTTDVLEALWEQIGEAFTRSLKNSGTDLQGFLQSLNPVWNVVGRVHFNLAENRQDVECPFAFMATYTTHLASNAKAQHVPLSQALHDYAGKAKHAKLLSLLLPVQRAAEGCDWLKAMVDEGEIFHPLRWTVTETSQFLAAVPGFERAGIVVRMPAAWSFKRPPSPKVTAHVGIRPPSRLGIEAILDFHVDVTLDGVSLTPQEINELLAGTESLVMLRGRWVEIDRHRLRAALAEFRAGEALAERDGISFRDAMRLLAGAGITDKSPERVDTEWSTVVAGTWLTNALDTLRGEHAADLHPGKNFHGTLRPYQRSGVHWLRVLSELGLGGCLADDMGLGKTIQVLSLLVLDKERKELNKPSILVVPASLLANWGDEVRKFTPSLRVMIAHASVMPDTDLRVLAPESFDDFDLVITTYGSIVRMPAFTETSWRFAILDEAQAIKNRDTKQARFVKTLPAEVRFALTGTPVENNLFDLWSIFDFINPGLLGTAKEFARYAQVLEKRQSHAPLRQLIQPYILRRMKTNKSVIADLPDKTEIKAYCNLSPKQAALYGEKVAALAKTLKEKTGIQRRGLILATLMHLKQICNHPSQWLNDGRWSEQDSGKFQRLREIGESIAARQEKVLVFTQFREATGPIAAFLSTIFGQSGLVLHGDTPIKQRQTLVKQFQDDESVPFLVLSLKVGGSGLNLTSATHVVHFDRWWNPAVENQATDRAYRIGQKTNVLVHKFICRGTLEDNIDAMIEAKQGLSDDVLSDGKEVNLTELNDDELLRLVSLDLKTTLGE